MMQLLCNGTFLDLYEGSGLQFTHKNPLFAFDALECERTTSFKIPATPKNDRVLALAKLPALSGVAMRRKYDAELYDGTVVKKGYIYVSNFDGKDYNAIFVTGELVGLQALKNAGKIRDLLLFDQAVTWDNTTTHTADEATLPDIGFVQYEREPSTAHLNASISLRWLMEQIATKTGVTINYLNTAGNERWRLLAAGADIYNLNDLAVHLVNRGAVGQEPINLQSLLGISQYKASGAYYDQCTARSDGQYLYWGTDGQPSMAQFDMLKFPYEISLEFGEDFPDDCFLATDGWYGSGGVYHDEPICDMVYDAMSQDYHFRLFPHNAIANFLGDYYLLWDGSTVGAPLAGRKVTIPANMPFMILPKAGLHYQEPEAVGDTAEIGYNADECPAYDYEVRISINHDFIYGEDVPLNAMLPEFTAVELLKLYAAINGCVLNYTDAQGVTFESLDFDNYAMRDIKALTKRGELVRTFSDYAQQNIVKMTPEDWVWLGERIKTQYTIDNDNIEAEKDLLVLKASEGGKKIAYTNDGEVHTRLLVRNDTESKRKAKDQTIALASVDDPYMLRVTIPTIEGLQNLCTASTQQKISALMTFLEYNAIQAKTLALVEGLRYVWTERSWQKNEAQFTLARLYEAGAAPVPPTPVIPYVTEGLVFWLDGIDKGNTAGKWTDLIGGIDYTPDGNVIFNDDHVLVSGVGRLIHDNIVGFLALSCTIEVTYYGRLRGTALFSSGNPQISGSQANLSTLECYTYSSRYIFSNARYSSVYGNLNDIGSAYNAGEDMARLVSFNIQCGIENMHEQARDNMGYSYSTPVEGKSVIGWQGGDGVDRKIYSIRIYNRQLSAAEMLHNQQVDNIRFNLGL